MFTRYSSSNVTLLDGNVALSLAVQAGAKISDRLKSSNVVETNASALNLDSFDNARYAVVPLSYYYFVQVGRRLFLLDILLYTTKS